MSLLWAVKSTVESSSICMIEDFNLQCKFVALHRVISFRNNSMPRALAVINH